MIKKCKVTRIINPPIRGIVDKPIREGNIVDMNPGQILACLGISTIDEILESGATVRLNLDNYKLDNSKATKEITIADAVAPLKTKIEDVVIPEPVETDIKDVTPEPIKEEETAPVEELVVDENTEVQETATVEATTEDRPVKENYNNKNKKRK